MSLLKRWEPQRVRMRLRTRARVIWLSAVGVIGYDVAGARNLDNMKGIPSGWKKRFAGLQPCACWRRSKELTLVWTRPALSVSLLTWCWWLTYKVTPNQKCSTCLVIVMACLQTGCWTQYSISKPGWSICIWTWCRSSFSARFVTILISIYLYS